ncbi:bifunctional 4-hydroxy-2-oxoglutarate aldolase/2-dehydro-3-deoxy-phosphogluconate aldolase [Actinoplanes aureus]|uniref:Bifunctional 4-hydroxy-2-oxoglutarate aldolase/2-dehydro-3-deoxy-phosphogluconate aldolase n=1 Tax=Actinoplanes aureus TaxID=2792083 RepID=A0A931CGA1_9ACTN|nr:bifunctional 4-hydroxy-2-oxoglutarate aldolase/2-dehydro-3-deoxy-phosphogluconate aldolase [Actinoplanes aureus]MBG0566676.1 bifunctional 4-hydroxy-2-oxoglutarate aldolase/2-dehydro-3-deoxy-phosphogluconate aldolase [Actinoplanes aureus]
MSVTDVLQGHRVVPVVVLNDPASADDLGAALVAGGLPIAEATFRTPEAAQVLRRLAQRADLVVGAGTVISARQVDLAHEAGARFIVSPGLSAEVVRRCQALDLPVIPGVSTATEIIAALDLGLNTVKFFPAEACGGLPTVKALSAAFPQVRFVPTGGITAQNAPAYLAHPAVAAVGGSWMVAPDLLAAGKWDEVTARCAGLQGAAS